MELLGSQESGVRSQESGVVAFGLMNVTFVGAGLGV
jgi:hypothetical protein